MKIMRNKIMTMMMKKKTKINWLVKIWKKMRRRLMMKKKNKR
jgi:hypothetical protein